MKEFAMYKRSQEGTANFSVENNIVKDVEVFRTGVFRKNLYDADYIQALVDNFYLLKQKDLFRNVPVRQDHSDWLGVRNSMQEVIGYVIDLRAVPNGDIIVKKVVHDQEGNEKRESVTIQDVRLVADLEITEPDILAKIMRTTYRDRSSEIGTFPDNDGDMYSPVFMGVAFVDIPQVDRLKSLFSKYDKLEVDMVKLSDEQIKAEAVENETPNTGGTPEAEKATPGAEETVSDNEVVEGEEGEGAVEEEKGEENEEENAAEEEAGEGEKGEENEEENGEEGEEKGAREEGGVEKNSLFAHERLELETLRKEKYERELKDKQEYFDKLVNDGLSTPAMAKLESDLIKSFFLAEGQEGYLSASQKFNLFKDIKASSPKVWSKEDVQVSDDTEEKDKAKKNSKLKSESDHSASEAEARAFARKAIQNAGLRAKDAE